MQKEKCRRECPRTRDNYKGCNMGVSGMPEGKERENGVKEIFE